jgi:HK97 family phage major capsid protein
MDKLIALIESLDARLKEIDIEQEGIEAKAEKENGGLFSADMRAQYDKLQTEYDTKKAERDAAKADYDRQKSRSEREKLQAPKRRSAPDSQASVGNAKPAAADDPKRGFNSHRDFLSAVMDAGRTGRIDERLHLCMADRNATAGSDEAGTYSDPVGGFLIPKGFSPNLLSVMAEADPLNGRTTQIPMTNAVVDIPARVDKNHTDSVSGGLRVYRRAETQTVSASRMEFEQVTLRAHALFGVAYATEELLARSPISFVALLEAGFRDEFGAKLIDERINGSGVGMMEGVLTTPALVSVGKETGQAADTITYENIVKMRARCWGYGNAIWLANNDTLPQLMTLNQAVGTGGMGMIWQPSALPDHPDTLLGRPLIFTDYVNTLGDQGDIICGNWSQYLEGVLSGMSSDESVHVRFLEHERTFKFWMENDGRCWWRSALTPKNSTVTRSPFVTLDARA